MRIDVITILPEIFREFLEASLIGRAREAGLLEVRLHDLRDYTDDPHRSVDDEPYGGGGGMVMTAPPWLKAVRAVAGGDSGARRILLSPQGERLDDAKAQSLAGEKRLVLLCGRYEAVDERVRTLVVDSELSVGDYVLSGGEVPAMVVIEAVSRQIPGVVGRHSSVVNESFRSGLLDYPHYTRPAVVEGIEVPEVLRSGDHRRIDRWRREQALEATRRKRPDLLGGQAAAPVVAPGRPNRR
ncbi:MAG: tRNA (guanosine(37)-N1)-methyltransferase TrmD [Acidobacteria bacterium]|nr:tRNA (guanosine(37)-N1)-methyltransferase TrmD [Acidobacteriota bacterium]